MAQSRWSGNNSPLALRLWPVIVMVAQNAALRSISGVASSAMRFHSCRIAPWLTTRSVNPTDVAHLPSASTAAKRRAGLREAVIRSKTELVLGNAATSSRTAGASHSALRAERADALTLGIALATSSTKKRSKASWRSETMAGSFGTAFASVLIN